MALLILNGDQKDCWCNVSTIITEIFNMFGNAVWVGFNQRENIELCFIMTMENIAQCAHYGKENTLLNFDIK